MFMVVCPCVKLLSRPGCKKTFPCTLRLLEQATPSAGQAVIETGWVKENHNASVYELSYAALKLKS